MKIRQIVLLLSLANPVISAQNIYVSSGLTYNSATVRILNSQTGNLVDFKSHKIAIDYLNVLAEIEISGKTSFKTGFYFHPEYFEYITSERESYGGVIHYYHYTNKILRRNLDFPFLVSLHNIESGTKYSFDARLYIGFAISSSMTALYSPGFSSFDFGTGISFSMGSEKWQFSLYSLIGLKNLLDANYPGQIKEGEKARGFTLGLNMTRAVSLKNKSTL